MNDKQNGQSEKICALLRRYATYNANSLLTFRHNV